MVSLDCYPGQTLIVAETCTRSAFTATDRLVTCSLLGAVSQYTISRDAEGKLQATKGWGAVAKSLEKVNAMTADEARVVLGGFGKDGKGIVELWQVR